MPTYEYVCNKCGLELEVVHSMSADALTICPQDRCGRKKWGRGRLTKKLGASPGLLFKGNGFYITDYRSEGYKSAAKNETGGESKPAAKPEGKPDAKPAAKPAAKSESKPAPAKPASPKQ